MSKIPCAEFHVTYDVDDDFTHKHYLVKHKGGLYSVIDNLGQFSIWEETKQYIQNVFKGRRICTIENAFKELE